MILLFVLDLEVKLYPGNQQWWSLQNRTYKQHGGIFKKKIFSIDFSMVLGDIFTIVIAIVANNYKSLNLKDSIQKFLKFKNLK